MVSVARHLTQYEFQLKGSEERVQTCTTHNFDGIIAIIDPETSWVARWQRTCRLHIPISLCDVSDLAAAKYVRGMYAVRVKGRIPEEIEAELESRGIKYRPRDQTDQD